LPVPVYHAAGVSRFSVITEALARRSRGRGRADAALGVGDEWDGSGDKLSEAAVCAALQPPRGQPAPMRL
jgi:hypothetical protein